MRICSICKQQGEIGNNGYCKPCNRAYGKRNYHENKERYFRIAKERDKRLDDLINSYKSKPCTDCGKTYPPYVMDLDHIDPTQKIEKVSTMRRRRMAFSTIIAEIEKCEVVCANCHRERTNRQTPSRYSK